MTTEYSHEVCIVCGIHYAVEKRIIDYRRKLPASDKDRHWFCPNGHQLVARESEADTQRRRAERAEQQLAQRDDVIRQKERELVSAKREMTRVKKRSHAGVCLECHRTFQNVSRHMKTKHPEVPIQ